MFADDTQLCKSFPPTDYDSLVLFLQKKNTVDVKVWTLEDKLWLNDDHAYSPSNSVLALLTPFQTPFWPFLLPFKLHFGPS